MESKMNILFVCTGNTCRSPMAEHLLKKKLAEEGLDHLVQIRSGGISAVLGAKASQHAIEVLRRRNHPQLEMHRSTPVRKEMVEQADLILTMTITHKQILSAQYPKSSGKLFTLLEYIADHPEQNTRTILNQFPNTDIADPFGGDLDQYEACARQLESAIECLYQKIRQQIQ